MRIRFTLRELLLLVAIIGLVLGWWLDHAQSERRIRKAEFAEWKQEERSTRLIDVLSQLSGEARELPELLNRGFGGELEAGHGYENVKTLADALALAQANLVQDNRGAYAVLLTEDRIRAAIASAVQRRDATIDEQELQNPGAKVRWESIRPVFLSISETGAWPAGSSISTQYQAYDEHMNAYQGLRVTLHLALQINGTTSPSGSANVAGEATTVTDGSAPLLPAVGGMALAPLLPMDGGHLDLIELLFRK